MTNTPAAYRRNKPRHASEHEEQAALLQWAALQSGAYPELNLIYATPNGARTSMSVAKRLKAEGMKKGVPDLCLPVARLDYHGLYIEMKAYGGRLSPEQRCWLDQLARQGYLAVVCWGHEEAIECISSYLLGQKS